MTRLVLATGNRDKIHEIEPHFRELDVELVAAVDEVPGWSVEESGTTLLTNAELKARAAATATGLPAVADDTGLFVDALGGAPGVHSSRYAGEKATYEDNVKKLLEALKGVGHREARFITAVCLIGPNGREASFEGVLDGRIASQPRGREGFGYDPVFVVEGDLTLAELTLQEKNAISHRGRAFHAAAEFLAAKPGWLAGELDGAPTNS